LREFIDYSTGDICQGRHLWKPLSDVFLEYIDHPEGRYWNIEKETSEA